LANFSAEQGANFRNLVELLRVRAQEHGSRVAFRYLADGEIEEVSLTYAELEARAVNIAAALRPRTKPGDRALLFYTGSVEFVAAFWGCVYAGVVAVPVFPARLHRQLPRLLAIAADSEAALILTTAKIHRQSEDLFKRAPELKLLTWLATDDLPNASIDSNIAAANLDTLAFLQYTSGSTAAPRGVMVTHGNLLHNLSCLREVFQFSEQSVGVTWLPHFHDMGLIGGLLQPLYAGGEMIVMPPSTFLQRPIRWLEAVTKYKATTMVAPNFAYELCVEKISAEQREQINLSSVKVALCGAEPVRPDTLRNFSKSFAHCGFSQESFRPAYGLAEATLIVSGRSEGGAPIMPAVKAEELRRNRVVSVSAESAGSRTLVGCGGIAPGLDVKIVDPDTRSICANDRVGEIWISGPSVTRGYWHRDAETLETFGAYLATGEGPYLRTGDLGFVDQGQLFIAGRLKDLIIIRASNHYPQDLEHTVERSHRALRPACGAAFSIDVDGAERLVIVQEVNDRVSASSEDVVAEIRRALAESHEVHPDAVVLIEPRTISRTSSGKIQRYACREAFLGGTLEIVHEWRDTETRSDQKQNGASRLRSGLVWDYLSTQSHSHRLAGNASRNSGESAAARPESNENEPIAIIGMGCKFPGASGLDEFWTLLRNGVDAISEIPRDRWDVGALYDPLPGTTGKMSTRWGGFLPDIDQFDPHFFGISPREAASMDPQQRVLLEMTWEALENAGQPPDQLAGTRTGVFVGIGGFDYSNVIINYKNHLQIINAYLGTGNAHSIAANRISYLLDLRGPSIAIDTACSSSLVAIHMACDSLRGAHSNLAIAGAVNLILSPEATIAFSHARMMAADGRCKAFDAKADGYVRAEGCGVVILKRLSEALRDRDNILGIIRGSAINQDGRTAGIAAPNASAQQAVIREALVQAGVSPKELTYFEAHGTGTSIGDPIEVEAIRGVLGDAAPDELPCLMGSVKANVGHLENASGMASLGKVLACLQHDQIPAQLHFSKLNPRISLVGTRIAIPQALQPWPATPRRIAGISSFGFGGTNAHIIVEEAPPRIRKEGLPDRPWHILTLSARTERAVKTLASRFEKYLAHHAEESLADICFTANAGRSHFARRIAVIAENKEQLQKSLAAFAAGQQDSRVVCELSARHSTKKDGLRTAFVFGAEASSACAAHQLYATHPVFRAAMDRCSRFLGLHQYEPLLAALTVEQNCLERRDVALFALEFALGELWQSWGIQPDAVLGTGVGEYSAAVISEVMSCEDALKLIAERARILRLTPESGELNRMLDKFDAEASSIKFQSPKVSFVSGLSGHTLAEDDIPGANYWRLHVLQHSHLGEGLRTLRVQGCAQFIGVGTSNPFCEEDSAENLKATATFLPSLDPNESGWQTVLTSLGSLYVRGSNVNWKSFDEPYQPRKIALPSYPFERERCWENLPSAKVFQKSKKRLHELLGERMNSALPMAQFQSRIGTETLQYLSDHKVQGSVVLPAAVYLEMAQAATAEILGTGPSILSNITFQEALILPAAGERLLQFVSTPASAGNASFQIYSSHTHANGNQENAGWTLHASGDMRLESENIARCTQEQYSIGEIQARCPRQKSAVELYASLKDAGLEYGPAFQGVQEVWCGSREALGHISLPEQVQPSPDHDYSEASWIHPVMLDSCLQVLAAALPEERGGSRRKWTYLPVGVGSLRFTGRPGRHLFSHAALRQESNLGAEFLEADIRLLGEDGSVVAELLGFRAKLVSADAELGSRENPDDLLYDVSWIEKPLAAKKSADHVQPSPCLIVAGRGGLGQLLAERLQEQGKACVIADDGNAQSLLASLEGADVIHLSSLDVESTGEHSNSVLTAQEHWIETAKLIQSLLKIPRTERKRLWIVTRGAQSVGTSPHPVSIAQTPLWGLAKSIDLEHPELACTRIDLDPQGDADELISLEEELTVSGPEREVAFRKGTRYVSRLVQRTRKAANGALMEIPAADSFRMEMSRPGKLDNLLLRASPRPEPRPGEVEIRVMDAGLNFRDVMNAAGVYPGGPIPFGAECAGKISSVGAGVTDFKVGDEVLAVANASFGSYTTADARAVVPKPPAFSFGQAATIPIAFLTAYYSLNYLARLSRGERVLIHAAAGGVGLAAVQLAKHAGAEIFATAGSPEKRAYLKSMRVPHIMDSRSLNFADEIMKKTGGKGVDVVLNSLPGEYITRSLSTLGAYGRFVEIGKTDIYLNKPLGLFPFRNNLSYFALDLELVCRERPDLLRSLLLELMEMFKQGSLKPLPHNIFSVEDAANGFRYMSRRKNIGKVVISFGGNQPKNSSDRSPAPRADATYLITGGNGGLGLSVARWLSENGARHLVLLSRSGASKASDDLASELKEHGTTVVGMQCDVSNESDMRRRLSKIRDTMPPLRGIIHAAGVLDDHVFLKLEPENFLRVLAPKVLGAWNLHTLTASLPLDFFVLFSSVASVLGSPGQANYAAANAFLDGLAEDRRAHGLPGLSINWGPWADVGMAARAASAHGPASRVLRPIPPAQALAILDRLFEKNGPAQAVAMSVDWDLLERSLNGQPPPALIADLIREKGCPASAKSARAGELRFSTEELWNGPAEQRHGLILAHVQKNLAQVMALESPELDPEESLTNLGLDSLMALELQHALEESFSIKLPIELLMGMPSLNEFVNRLLEILAKSAPNPAQEISQDIVGHNVKLNQDFPPNVEA
jgi:acyl transferase domain-containing protein/acyl-CoA synthetase (AMP-forming)/AMP-acid ligase II/acyl carrier protein